MEGAHSTATATAVEPNTDSFVATNDGVSHGLVPAFEAAADVTAPSDGVGPSPPTPHDDASHGLGLLPHPQRDDAEDETTLPVPALPPAPVHESLPTNGAPQAILPNLPYIARADGPLEDGPGAFEIYYDNLENVPLEKQMPYIMMMATNCIADFNVKDIHPYSVFMAKPKLAGGGWVRKLNPNKDLVCQELKRRDPTAKPNKSNKGLEEISRLFAPITDQRDVDFVAKKEAEFRQKMLDFLEEYEDKRARPRQYDKRVKRPRTEAKAEVKEIGGNIVVGGGDGYLQCNGSLTMASAESMIAAAEQEAMSHGWKVFIAIADSNGSPLIIKRVNDAFSPSFEIALAKAKAASQLGKNTGRLEDVLDISYGGLAVVIDDICCGGIGVSGDKPAKFELVANAGITALKDMASEGVDLESENGMLDV